MLALLSIFNSYVELNGQIMQKVKENSKSKKIKVVPKSMETISTMHNTGMSVLFFEDFLYTPELLNYFLYKNQNYN